MSKMVTCPTCGGLAFLSSGEVECPKCGKVRRPPRARPVPPQQPSDPPREQAKPSSPSVTFPLDLSGTEATGSQRNILCSGAMTYVLVALLIVPFFFLGVGGIVPVPLILLFAAMGTVAGWFVFRFFCEPNLENEFAVTVTQAIGTFFFTAIVGVVLLSVFNELAKTAAENPSWGRGLPVVRIGYWIMKVIGYGLRQSNNEANPIAQFFGMLVGVGICEEATKLLAVLFLLRTTSESKLRFRNIVFIGAMSGLGFGIAESILYVFQTPTVGMCIVRFTTLPLCHGAWTILSSAILFGAKQQARTQLKADQMGVAAAVGFVTLVCLGSAVFHAFYNTLPPLGIFSNAALVYGLSRWKAPFGETAKPGPAAIRSGLRKGTDKKVQLALGVAGGIALGVIGLIAVVAVTQQNHSSPQPNSQFVAADGLAPGQTTVEPPRRPTREEILVLDGQIDPRTGKRKPNPGPLPSQDSARLQGQLSSETDSRPFVNEPEIANAQTNRESSQQGEAANTATPSSTSTTSASRLPAAVGALGTSLSQGGKGDTNPIVKVLAQRKPIPDKVALDDARKRLISKLDELEAKATVPLKMGERAKLAFELAQQTNDDPPTQYYLADRSWNLYLYANDLKSAFAVSEWLAQRYEIDPLAKRSEALVRLLRKDLDAETRTAVCSSIPETFQAVMKENRLDLGSQLIAAGLSMARRIHDWESVRDLEKKQQQIDEMRRKASQVNVNSSQTSEAASAQSESAKARPVAVKANSGPITAGNTAWVGLAMPMKGPGFQKNVSTIKVMLTMTGDESFRGTYQWTSFSNQGAGNTGVQEVTGTLSPTAINWKGNNVGSGVVKNGAMCVSSEEPPYFAEIWLIPETHAVRPALLAGKYRVAERGVFAFDISLFQDGMAKKSHAPNTAGLWLANKDSILIIWTDGFRDLLTKEKGGFQKLAFAPATSLNGEGINPGVASKVE